MKEYKEKIKEVIDFLEGYYDPVNDYDGFSLLLEREMERVYHMGYNDGFDNVFNSKKVVGKIKK